MPSMPFTSPLSYLGALALIFGFFLIIAGLKIVTVEKVSVKEGPTTWKFGVVLVAVGMAALLPDVSRSLSQTPNLTPTLEKEPTATSFPISPTNTLFPQTDIPTPVQHRIVYFSDSTFHIGDEEFRDWVHLNGECFDISFRIDFLIQTLTLELETFGAEVPNPLSLNGRRIAVLPPQEAKSAGARPNEWTEVRYISIPTSDIVEGFNILKLCSELTPVPEFSGDKDDFQFRSIRLIAN
ncbi:MAG: hypothetical protein IPM84_10795 [Anaerolineae bacterium]|nr:hypothetical protein [Anaerolineae bacterium]